MSATPHYVKQTAGEAVTTLTSIQDLKQMSPALQRSFPHDLASLSTAASMQKRDSCSRLLERLLNRQNLPRRPMRSCNDKDARYRSLTEKGCPAATEILFERHTSRSFPDPAPIPAARKLCRAWGLGIEGAVGFNR